MLHKKFFFLPSLFPKDGTIKQTCVFSCLGGVCKDVRLENCSEKNTNVKIPAGVVSPRGGRKLPPQGVEGGKELKEAAGSQLVKG